ncbi:alpha/beta fold hydrolase [Chondromyces crocatus]|uniref:AB hydrolase-1 domain-containing protein n=1 Tax=Chondromyces crocatus TaxID=52 RepID=A0A0K1ERL1_CHOCO|nr:alpha/beta hydrolase [Chondromyces crocatus]AKT43292.1 uncharacterized protein CMC5_075240 [Chondromyces crocatus]
MSRLHSSTGRAAAVILGAAMLGGCGADASPLGDATAVEEGAIVWEPCAPVQGGGGPEAACALVGLPLDWAAPDGEVLTLFVKRVRGAEAPRRSLWLLAGAPGASGASFEAAVPALLEMDPALEIFLLDHRGAGRSTPLGCPGEPFGEAALPLEVWGGCVEALRSTWGDRLEHFNTTAAARDLGALIEATREPGRAVHVYGTSYGAVWAQRYLQLFPEQPDAITLDGLLTAGGGQPFWVDAWHDRAGDALFGHCMDDPVCRAKVGDQPRVTVETFFARIDAARCAPLDDGRVSRARMRQVFATLMPHEALRAAIPAIVYRGLRCEPGDAEAILHAVDVAARLSPPSGSPQRTSSALGMHLMLSELAPEAPPPAEELKAIQRAAHVSPDRGELHRALYDTWPRYVPDASSEVAPTTEVPVLMLHGALDPQVPVEVAKEIASRFQGAHQTLVALEPAARGLKLDAPEGIPALDSCALSLWMRFLKDPEAPVDASCARSMGGIPFAGSTSLAQEVFGTGDLWENRGGV